MFFSTGKVEIRNCSRYRGVKRLQHGLKVVVRVLEKSLLIMVTVDKMQCGFMRERATMDAVFMLRRLQAEHHVEGNLLYIVGDTTRF